MSAHLKTIGTPSVRDRVSKEEWQMRVDLAAAYQLAAIFKWTDLIYTHFSARVPGSADFLINPYGLMFDEITASNLVKIDHHGKVLDDPLDLGYNEAGFVIHGCVHEARPEVNCVIHTHTRAGVAVSAMKCGLLPVSQHAMMVQQQVTYHDYEGIALEMDERERMARDIVDRIAREVQIAMAKQEVKDGLARYAFEAQSSTPTQLAEFHREQLEIWKKTVRDVGIVPD